MSDPYALAAATSRRTPQTQRIPGRTDQVKNSAGGFVFGLEPLDQLKRFLILGTEGGSYYASERRLTRENAAVIQRALDTHPTQAVSLIIEISVEGRAPKPNPAIFALAVAAAHPNPVVRRRALAHLSDVCRTGTHLFTFLTYVTLFRGWGRGLRTAVADWYLGKTPQQVAYQTTKYASRGGWSHRDALRLAKPRPPRGLDMDMVLARAVGKDDRTRDVSHEEGSGLGYLRAVDFVRSPLAEKGLIPMTITEHKLPWEVLPSEMLRDPRIWEALLPHMGLTALIRNLGRLTDIGLIRPMNGHEATVCSRLCDPEEIRKARVHPLQILTAMQTYRKGRGDKGSLTWNPTPMILASLEAAFQLSFGNVVPANKRTLLCLDVSASMAYGSIAGSPLTPREASVAMAMVALKTEPLVATMAFSTTFQHLPLSTATSLGEAIRMASNLPFRGTDCSRPMQWAQQCDLEIDTFVIYTDNETYAGSAHPTQALAEYRRKMGIDAKLVVVGMVSNGFTIADPRDRGMLDVVGFDTATPTLINDFSRGDV